MHAAIEHLVGAKTCPVIEVWRLPVGHTHEDIDGRFNTSSTSIREILVEYKFIRLAIEVFSNECDSI